MTDEDIAWLIRRFPYPRFIMDPMWQAARNHLAEVLQGYEDDVDEVPMESALAVGMTYAEACREVEDYIGDKADASDPLQGCYRTLTSEFRRVLARRLRDRQHRST